MVKRLSLTITLLVILTLIAACGGAPAPEPQEEAPAPAQEQEEEVVEEPAAEEPAEEEVAEEPAEEPAAEETMLKFGEVTDVGGVDDRGFNQLAWEGLQRAKDELGVEVTHLESNADNALENIDQFVGEGYNGIVAVGFEFASATKTASLANPDVPFVSIDFPSQTAHDLGVLLLLQERLFPHELQIPV